MKRFALVDNGNWTQKLFAKTTRHSHPMMLKFGYNPMRIILKLIKKQCADQYLFIYLDFIQKFFSSK